MAANVGKSEVYFSGATEEAKQKILGVLHSKAKSDKVFDSSYFRLTFLEGVQTSV